MSEYRSPLQIIATGKVVGKPVREYNGNTFYSIVVDVPGEFPKQIKLGIRNKEDWEVIPKNCEIEAVGYVGGKWNKDQTDVFTSINMGKYTILSAYAKPAQQPQAAASTAPMQSPTAIVSDPMGLATMDPTKRAELKAMIGNEAFAKAWAAAGMEPEDDLPF